VRLIVNADDFGYTPGVTRGIMRAHQSGIVTATTLMANAPDTEGAAKAARADQTLDVGVHLVFTYGLPLTAADRVASLVSEAGAFPRVTDLLRSGRPNADEALIEARAQYQRVRQLLGRDPTHIDTHHWVHDLPALEDAVIALAKETGAAARAHDGRQRARFRDAGVRTPDRFVREYQHTGKIGVERLVGLLEVLSEDAGVIELMCHPGEPDEALMSGSTYAAERGVELEALTDPAVRRAIERLRIELIDFSVL
jgi:predicted glycoside hydrolase/deacetylase ChbG (UPF0249 family)